MVARPGARQAVIRGLWPRLATALATLAVLQGVGFALLHLAPGDAADLAEDPSLSYEDREHLRRALGLDQPPWARFAAYAAHVLQGDLGVSLTKHRPVASVLGEALGPTLLLSGSALVIALAIGWVVGTRAAARPRGIAARLVRTALPALDAAPPFWLGLAAVLLFSWHLGWLPAGAMRAPASTATGFAALGDVLRHLVLPVLVIALPGAAPVARHQWVAMRRELAAGHVVAARAMGVPERTIVWRRAARAALQPLLALVGLAFPALVGGAVVVEVVFAWPGLGRVHHEALLARDVPLAMGGLLVIGVVVVLGGLVAEALSLWADPRLRGAARGER